MTFVFPLYDSRAVSDDTVGHARDMESAVLTMPSAFRDDLNPVFGIPSIPPTPGESFDRNNDLWLGADGRTVYHRDGFISYGGPADALVAYDQRRMTRAAFAEHYGDEREEDLRVLHGV